MATVPIEHVISIVELEETINVLTIQEGVNKPDFKLGKKVRCLADVYGLMIYEKKLDIPLSDLTEQQVAVYLEGRSLLSDARI